MKPIRTFSANVADAMIAAGLSPGDYQELARRLGVAPDSVGRFLTKHSEPYSLPQPAVVDKYAAALGCTRADLMRTA